MVRGPLLAEAFETGAAVAVAPPEVLAEPIPINIVSCYWTNRTGPTRKTKKSPICRRPLQRVTAIFGAVAVTAAIVMALAPGRAAADHDTVGGGSFFVSNSDAPCTDFRAGSVPYTVCAGNSITLIAPADYVVVPLGSHASVSCDTYTPDGSLFEHDVENLSDVPEKQRFWAQRGWGPYTPEAMCQLW
ncbi:hypothetical protein MAUB_46830 [Mycolicibacterium aubagnense]|uniref:Secreted protein n=1 Tax=Mycolicibacterium aubagnense TaxID=319707 RepID=A0ABM7IJ38_9MYCO|nr:hypothetical protein MAUB_46830 [Mycolicibacterium aubagnense]